MKNDKIITAIAAILIATIFLGEILAYVFVPYSFDSSAEIDGTVMDYSVTSSAPNEYTSVFFDNGNFEAVDDVYLYYDKDYVTSSITDSACKKNINSISEELSIRGMKSTTVNAIELAELFDDPDATGKAVVTISGALPDTVYYNAAVRSDDGIFKWLRNGGSIYWFGDMIGRGVAHTRDSAVALTVVDDDFSSLFFGVSDAINCQPSSMTFARNPSADREIGDALNIMYNATAYGISTSLSESLSIGFEMDGYGSVTLARYLGGTDPDAKGMICVFGGPTYSSDHKYAAQLIASGLSYDSEILDIRSGVVSAGRLTGTIVVSSVPQSPIVYIHIGDVTVYGKRHSL